MRPCCPRTGAWLAFDRRHLYTQCTFFGMREMLPVRQLGESVGRRIMCHQREIFQLFWKARLHISPVNAMPPVVIGIIQTLTEGQSVTDKLLGLSLISQLLLFRLTLQLNREGTTVDLLRKREGDNTEQRQWKRREKRGIQRIRERGKQEMNRKKERK